MKKLFILSILFNLYLCGMQESLDLSKWVDDDGLLQALPKEKYYLNNIVQCFGYSNHEYNQQNRNIFIFVSPDISNQREKNILLTSLKKLCSKVGELEERKVILLWFYASSNCSLDALEKQSKYLADLISFFQDSYVYTIGYGLSGAIIKGSTKFLQDQIINLIVFLGTPIVESSDKRFITTNYEKIINFYSNADFAQIFQNMSVKSLISGVCANRKLCETIGLERAYDIRAQINGNECTHSELLKVIKKLFEILKLLARYKHHNDLELNIGFEQSLNEQLQLAIRKEKGYSSINEETIDEINFSNEQKLIFQGLYQKDMSEKQSRLDKTLSTDFAKQVMHSLTGFWSKKE